MCESLKPELDRCGVGLSVVCPGFVRTPLTDRNTFPMPFLMEPEDAAERIVRGLHRGNFEISFPRRFTMWLKLGRCLPYAWYFPLTRRMVGNDGA
jgi:short-subunit dehydrogenase